MRSYVAGFEDVARALAKGEPVQVLLVERGDARAETLDLVARARQANVLIWEGGPGDMRRMSRSPEPPPCMAMLGPCPRATLPELMGRGGISWLLHKVGYPSNIGFAVRTAEVSGASGVIVDAVLNHQDRARIDHVSMGAASLLPLLYADTHAVLDAAHSAGVRVVAIEDVGTCAPWDVSLSGPVVCVIGGERDGIAREVLARCDDVVRLPMAGFVPSYNLQGAMAAVAVERLRQIKA